MSASCIDTLGKGREGEMETGSECVREREREGVGERHLAGRPVRQPYAPACAIIVLIH